MEKGKAFSILGLILSIISIILLVATLFVSRFLPSMGFSIIYFLISAVLGLIFSIVGLKKSGKKGFTIVVIAVSTLILVIPLGFAIFLYLVFTLPPLQNCWSARSQISIVADKNTCVASNGDISINIKGGGNSNIEAVVVSVQTKDYPNLGVTNIPRGMLPWSGQEQVFHIPEGQATPYSFKGASSIEISAYSQAFMTSQNCGVFQKIALPPCE